VPALVVAGRWLKGFGTSGLTADEAQGAREKVSEVRDELQATTRKLDAATAQVARLTKERDELAAVAEAEAQRRAGGRK
jgi:hypothetical protein